MDETISEQQYSSPYVSYQALYDAFPVTGTQTRILKLHDDAADPEIYCELRVIDLSNPDSHEEYVAVSYTWGIEPPDQPIRCNGFQILITKSCKSALRALRKRDETFVWIDQISINQESIPERNQQVALMHQVYSLAHQTYVWLGELSEIEWQIPDQPTQVTNSDKGRALDAAQCLHQRVNQYDPVDPARVSDYTPDTTKRALEAIQAMRGSSANDSDVVQDWVAQTRVAVDFLNRKYFTRRWVVQELALSSTVRMLFGEASWQLWQFSYLGTEISVTMSILEDADDQESAQSLVELAFGLDHERLLDSAMNKFGNFAEMWSIKIMVSELQGGDVPLIDPIEVLARCSGFEVTVPHDSVYALGALLDRKAGMPKPDYASDCAQMFVEQSVTFVRQGWGARMLSSGTLNLDNNKNLPSWILEFRAPGQQVSTTGDERALVFRDPGLTLKAQSISVERWRIIHENNNYTYTNRHTGQAVEAVQLLPCSAERLKPDIRLLGASPSHELIVDGFVLDIVVAIAEPDFYRRPENHGYTPSNIWDFYHQSRPSRSAEVQQFLKRSAWWTDIVYDDGPGYAYLIDEHPTYNTERVLSFLAGGYITERDENLRLLDEFLQTVNGRMQSDREEGLGHEDQEEAVSDLKFAVTTAGWPVLVPRSVELGHSIAFFHGVRTPFALCINEQGKSRILGRVHVLSLMWWWDWTLELEALKRTEVFVLV